MMAARTVAADTLMPPICQAELCRRRSSLLLPHYFYAMRIYYDAEYIDIMIITDV